jgi:CheY-like chemotaxis protein/HPt (histidine-containing phosphotransfer) domain-containing protein
LQKLGYQADAVANGLEVLKTLEMVPYDVILMDCQMPEMDGFEATAEVRRREGEQRHTPIIAMTANALKGDRERCLAAGMDDYISKPVRTEELAALLQRWVGGVTVRSHEAVQPAAAEPDTLTLDQEKLNELDELSGDDEASLVVQMIDLFLADAHPRLAQIREAVEREDAGQLDRVAHALKGSASHFGVQQMVELCAQLEAAGRERQWSGVPDLLSRLLEEFPRVERALQGERAKRVQR